MDTGIFEIKETLNKPAEEAYKVLRTNMQFIDPGNRIKTIAVTSFKPGEGKTTTSVNLALSLAKTGLNVLYVDADLRKPMIMKKLGNSELKGLSNFLLGHVPFEKIINTTNINGFSFVACGIRPVNPVELIDSAVFTEFLKKVKDRYGMVIIDTPPIGSVIDSALIASKTDGTIVVIQANAVKRKNAKMLMEQLKKANANVLGVVLNKLSKREYKDFYANYDYYGSHKEYAKSWYGKYKSNKRSKP